MSVALLTNSVPAALTGRAEPRISTPPLVTGPAGECGCGCALTPRTSKGFELIEFAAEVLNVPFLPWQRYVAIHGLEQTALGLPRFKTILVLVGRQNGKTHFMKSLALWRMFMDGSRLVLSVAQTVDTARESWSDAATTAETNPMMAGEVLSVRRANGQEEIKLHSGARWKVAAANGSAGRGLTVDTLFMDEMRQQYTWDAWAALAPTTTVPVDSQIWCVTSAGEDASVVLNGLRASALTNADDTLGIFEWSAPDGCALDDTEAWTYSMPGLGHTVTERTIRGFLATYPPEKFRTEILCQHVTSMSNAIDMAAWEDCADPTGKVDRQAGPVMLCLDVSPDLKHVTLAAAQKASDGRVRVGIVAAWDSTEEARRALPDVLRAARAHKVAWFPGGPAAALAADLTTVKRTHEIKATELLAVCQGFSDAVTSRRLLHNADPLLTAHAASAQRLPVGDGWRFGRRDVGHVDALYAAAGAVHMARSTPTPSLKIITRE